MARSDAEKKLNRLGIVNIVFNAVALICIIVFASAIYTQGRWLIAMTFVLFGTELLFLLPYPSFALPGRGLYAGGLLGIYTAKKIYDSHWYRKDASFMQIARLENRMKKPEIMTTLPSVEAAIGGIFFIAGIAMMILNYYNDISAITGWLLSFVVILLILIAEGLYSNLHTLHLIKEIDKQSD